ncbi:hypothetical protein [Aeromonas enteropelogenes]|uniref:hypothetical protein n=1 Tax=Aeromonas enteropelogenes TaxID=29489 RepID=UPI003BA22BB9
MWFKVTIDSTDLAIANDIFAWDLKFIAKGMIGYSAYALLSDDALTLTYYLSSEFDVLIKRYGAEPCVMPSKTLEKNLKRIV